jgi:acyl transferase domain-containing protein/acyl carrier protein
MAGRFPGARNVAEFWQNLREGRDSIRTFSQEELLEEGVDESMLRQANFVPAGGVLEEIEWFDAAFFGMSPREAESMDPQQRILLETVQHALDDAGCDPERSPGPVAVFAGCRLSGYWMRLLQNSQLMAALGWHQVAAGNDKDFLATQISYRFNLRGPSVNVQSACATSLLAISLACDSLISGQCDVAIAGGASVAVPHRIGYMYYPSGIASPDGHCRPFDAQAKGSVLGNGVAAVVLKRVTDAVAVGDRIYAVIRGTAVNNDGTAKSSFAAPSVRGQADVIAAALQHAGVPPEDVEYIETHGTATTLGDAIEAAALGKIFAGRAQPCRIGSVKSNVGHLDPAAGVTSLIKVALSLYHGEIPASIHFDHPNPTIDFAGAGVRVLSANELWPRTNTSRIAGVSSFGIGGTNVHAVLTEAPAELSVVAGRPVYLLPISAKTPEALQAMSTEWADSIESNPQTPLHDMAFTASCGRRQFARRRYVVAGTHREAASALRQPVRRNSPSFLKDREAFFLFPGQGSQRCGMGGELYRAEPVFQRTINSLAEEAARYLGFDLRSLMTPEGNAERNLHHTAVAQPFLFVTEYAAAQLWMDWNVLPAGMLGHSIGELVAACVAEVFSPEDAIRIVCERGLLMGSMEPGAMLAVNIDAATARGMEDEVIRISAINAPRLCTLSGSPDAIRSLEERLTAEGVEFRRLNTSHAFHHPSMQAASERLLQTLANVTFREPRIQFLSNLTGDWITAKQATNPEYWAESVVAPVLFSPCVQKLLGHSEAVLMECGPGLAMSSIVRSHLLSSETVVVSSMAQVGDGKEMASWLEAAGTVWQAGIPLDWRKMWSDRTGRRVTLPPYPFQRQRYWIDAPTRPTSPAPDGRRDVRKNCFLPSWQASEPPSRKQRPESDVWLVLAESEGLGLSLCAQLQLAGHAVVAAIPGGLYEAISDRAYRIDPSSAEHAGRLFEEPALAGGRIHLVVCWTLAPHLELTLERAQLGIEAGFHAPVTLLQALIRAGRKIASFLAVTSQLFGVKAEEQLDPAFAAVAGIVRVLSQEMPSVSARLIDITLPANSTEAATIVDQIIGELLSDAAEPVVAYRGPTRYAQSFGAATIPAGTEGRKRLRPGGTYLITGGFGGIGGVLAKLLASAGKCNLALVGRRGAAHPVSPLVQELESIGAEVLSLSGDVSNPVDVQRIVQSVRDRFGPIHGVIHAAGVAGGGMLGNRKLADADAVFAPKIQGTIALFSAIRADRPDFFVLCSSFASVHGGVGQADYCGANCFQDAFAAYARGMGVPAVSIDWPAWREIGMAANMNLPEELEFLRQKSLESGITVAEGAELFAGILAADVSQVVIMPFATSPLARAEAARPRPVPVVPVARKEVSEMSTDGLRAALEASLAAIWSQVLGVQDLKCDDNFFQLGGHSLMALQVVAAVRQRFPVRLDLSDIFEQPALGALTALVESRLVDSVNEMPHDQVRQLLASG